MNISIDRLLLAYRKTKYEAFRDTTASVHGAKFLKFETHLNLIWVRFNTRSRKNSIFP